MIEPITTSPLPWIGVLSMVEPALITRAVVGAVSGVVVLASLAAVPALAADGDGAGPVLTAAVATPAALVLGAAGSTGSRVAVDVADADGVVSVVVRLRDPAGVVRASVPAVLTAGTTTAGRWTSPPKPLPVTSATGAWRAEATACDVAASCTAAALASLTVRRDAFFSGSAASPARVVRGLRTRISSRLMVMTASGKYTARYDTTVGIEFQPAGTDVWKPIRTIRTDGRGRVSYPVKALRSGSWRLTYAGSSTYRARAGAAKYVDVSAVSSWVFGWSVKGRALRVHRIGDPDAARRVLVVGSVHGNERAGLSVVKRLRVAAPPKGVVYYLVPNLNPDGAARNTRQNARGVDLNRNFPHRWKKTGKRWDTYYPGRRASSEPEVRAAQRLIRSVSPTMSVWYHQHMNLVDPAGGPRAAALAYGKAAGMRVEQITRYRGSASSWQGSRWPSRPVFIVELPRRVSAAKASRHARALRAVSVLPR